MKKLTRFACASLALITLISCAKKSTDEDATSATEDSSVSGAVASSIGGTLSSSDASGTVAMNESIQQAPAKLWSMLLTRAYAATTCPKLTTAAGQGCTQNGNAADIVYSACSFGSSTATWTGTMEVTLASGAAVTCGAYPTLTSQTLQRQVRTSGAPGTMTRTSARGTTVTIDNSTANLGNYDGVTIAANIGTGYGTQVVFDGSSKRTQVIVKERVTGTLFDHSINGTLNLSESGTTRTISTGTVTTYHNKVKVIGTSTLTNVVYNNTCCTPVSGSIKTVYTAGTTSPSTLGALLVGKSETLTITACGTGTLEATDGTSTSVALTQCY